MHPPLSHGLQIYYVKKEEEEKSPNAILTKFRKQIGRQCGKLCDKIEKKGMIFLHVKSSDKSIKMSSH